MIPPFSTYTFVTSQRGQPHYKEQIELSQSVLQSEVPLNMRSVLCAVLCAVVHPYSTVYYALLRVATNVLGLDL